MGQCYRTPRIKEGLNITGGAAPSRGTKECKGVGNTADSPCSGLPSNRGSDPGNGHVELCGDLWMRVFSHLSACDLLSGCCAVCRQWRDWVHELSASQLSYKQDFTCQSCRRQVAVPLPDLAMEGLSSYIAARADTLKEIDIACQHITAEELSRLGLQYLETCQQTLGVGDMVMGRYKDLKALDLEFTFFRDKMPLNASSAVINERSYVLREVYSLKMLEVLILRLGPCTPRVYHPVFPNPQEHLPNVRELTLQGFGSDLSGNWFQSLEDMRNDRNNLVDFIMGLISLKTLRLSEHDLSYRGHELNPLGRLEQHPALEIVHLDAQCHLDWRNCAAMLNIPQLVTLSCDYLLNTRDDPSYMLRRRGIRDNLWDVDLRNSELKSIAIRAQKNVLSVDLHCFTVAPQLVYLELTSRKGFVWQRGIETAEPMPQDRPFKLVMASDWTQENQNRKVQASSFLGKMFGPSVEEHLPERLRPNMVQSSMAKGVVVYCNQQWIRNSKADQQQKRLTSFSAESPISPRLWFLRGVSHVNVNRVCRACEREGSQIRPCS